MIACRARSGAGRLEREYVLRRPREERRRVAGDPVGVPRAIERRQGMAALAARHVQVSVRFPAGRHAEALRRAEARRLHARHGPVARERVRRHIEEARQRRHGFAHRVADPRRVDRAPAAVGKSGTALRKVGDAGLRDVIEPCVPIGKARVERLAATADLWLGYGIGVFGTIGTTNTETRSGEAIRRDVPFIADRFARAGITFVHPSRIKLTLATTYVGERKGDLTGTALEDYWTTDAAITWESPDRHLLVGLTVLNIFDAKYEITPAIPGPTRAVAATVEARF